jgi:hypothetical protein
LKYLGAFTIASALVTGAPVQAADSSFWTGNNLIGACREVADTGRGATSKTSVFEQGICIGTVAALVDGGSILMQDLAFCTPKDVTYGQATSVVVKYMNNNPEQLHSPLSVLAMVALRDTWPCPSR